MDSVPFDPIDPAEARIALRVRTWSDRAVQPIDAAAIARSAVAPGRRARALPALGRRARLAALAITAGTLFLVAGSQPAPSPVPSPWAPSPALMGDEVLPGVLRLSEDAAGRDLRSGRTDSMNGVAFTPDGGTWVLGATEL